MSEDRTWNSKDPEERMYPDFIKEAQAAYQKTGDPVLGKLLLKKQGEYTVEDYYALPDTCRVELIDGVIYNMAAPRSVHQVVASQIWLQLNTWIEQRKGKCMAFMAPGDVQLDSDDKTMVQPDVYVCCVKDKKQSGNTKKKGQKKYHAFQGAPDMAIEVLSPSSSKRDRTLKYRKYREAGVREYWIVDPKARRVTVHLFERDEETTVYTYQDEIPVGIYDRECKISLADMEEKEALLEELGMLYDEEEIV